MIKLKAIIALALVATFASCSIGLNRQLDKLEEASKDGDAKEFLQVLETIEDRYTDLKQWNLEQFMRLGCAHSELIDNLYDNDDYQKYSDEREDIEKTLENISDNFDFDDDCFDY